MYKVIIWGTGIEYDKYINLIKYYEEKKQFKIVGITSDDNYFSYMDTYLYISKKDLPNTEYDYIIICAAKENLPHIRKEAVSRDISEDVLLSAHILLLPNFEFEKYIELVKSKISIFANNCWGGVVYERLGLKVRSPFCNMFEFDREYVDFLRNAKEIMLNERLHYRRMVYNDIFKFDYPVYGLGGMEIHMNHYPDPEQAERKWYERLDRINWDNLFVMMFTDNLEYMEKFSQLPYQKKICFTSLDTGIPFSYQLPVNPINQILPMNTVLPALQLGRVVNGSAFGRYKLYDFMELLLYGRLVNNRTQ